VPPEVLAKLKSDLSVEFDAKLEQRLAAIQALQSLPSPKKAAASKPKSASLIGSLMAASGHEAASTPAALESVLDDDPIETSDADNDTAGGMAAADAKLDLSKPIGAMLWSEEVLPYGSALSFVRMYQWKEPRNRHECEALAWSLDAMVKESGAVPQRSTSFEIQVRRLLGVKLADEHKDWALAESLAWKSGHGVQNRSLLRSLLKDRKNFAELKKSSAAAPVRSRQAFAGARGSWRGAGRGRGSRGGRNGKPSSAGESPAAAADG
jgi:hypothetical protein